MQAFLLSSLMSALLILQSGTATASAAGPLFKPSCQQKIAQEKSAHPSEADVQDLLTSLSKAVASFNQSTDNDTDLMAMAEARASYISLGGKISSAELNDISVACGW